MSDKSVFALVDANNFFVSCERVFAPHLEGKAVVVLSSNDGCAISRSNEAKALGIKMGEPFFKFKSLYEQKKVEVFSSNFLLYSNMSWRVMESLRSLCPSVEVYSVDEAFLGLELLNANDYTVFARETKQKLQQWTGIPVSIGIAPTKTLAKIANRLAKKTGGVYNLVECPDLENILSEFQIEDIWGIGRKLAPKLRMLGIGNAKDLRDSDPSFIRKNFSVVVERIVYELRGVSCLPLTDVHDDKKSITYSRTFGTPVTAVEELEEALSDYVSNACIKLRKQNSRALSISVFLSTNYHNIKLPRYQNSIVYTLPVPSSDTKDIIHYSKKCFHQIYKPGYQYNKLGIILLDLQSANIVQQHLFIKPNYTQSDKLMATLDLINNLMGKNTIFIAAQGTERAWTTQSQKCSPAFTTNINELPIVK
jgi:DNA polymerase V